MLRDLKFSDLYIGRETAMVSGAANDRDPVPVPSEHADEIASLRARCEADLSANGRQDFGVRHEGVSYRVAVINALNETIFVLRRFPDQVVPLEKIGIHKKLIDNLLEPKLTGLVVVAGAFSNGKTTTASAIVIARLKRLGGVAVTIEDPPEMALEGRHGEGVCYQTWAEQGGFAAACRRATRWAPTMIFLGEVRDAETAVEALRASVNGRLVICTTHADSIPSAIERLHTLASSVCGADDAAHLLSGGVAAVLHQRMEDHEDRKQVFVKSLWVKNASDEAGIRSTILSRRLAQLTTHVDQQRNQMLAHTGTKSF